MSNEKLVASGKGYISLNFIKTWDKEIERLNKNKVGASHLLLLGKFDYELEKAFFSFNELNGSIDSLTISSL